jgi:COP9 signalosome complex subunit 5
MSAAPIGNLKDDGSSSAPPPPPLKKQANNSMADARYSFDPTQLEALQKEKPWMKDPKYFEKVALSPSAVMKMMMHCASGVEKGIAKGGNPIEVMGLLLGRPDPVTPKTLIVTDAFPLPIEGFETRVIADDQNVVNHMISLNECLERSRNEKFMGWYHSHPFDVGDHSHCFLSQTDLSTQLQWQRAEDPHGNPFVAIVIDPLRSSHTNNPELKAFRAYPPEFQSPIANECPDGTIIPTEQVRLEQWGSCWNRYYELEVEYYMSSISRHTLEQLTQNYLWMRTLTSTKQDQDVIQEVQGATDTLKRASLLGSGSGGMLTTTTTTSTSSSTESASVVAAAAREDQQQARAGGAGAQSQGRLSQLRQQRQQQELLQRKSPNELTTAVAKVSKLATQELCEASLQQAKRRVFS